MWMITEWAIRKKPSVLGKPSQIARSQSTPPVKYPSQISQSNPPFKSIPSHLLYPYLPPLPPLMLCYLLSLSPA